MKRLLALCVAVMTVVGCGKGNTSEADFRAALPTANNVQLNVPADGSQALKAGTTAQAIQGQTAAMYELTRGVTVTVNLGTLFALGLIKAIVNQPATTIDSNTATWGPWTDSLSPTTWKLDVVKSGDDIYSYTLEGKAKAAPDSAYVVVLSGTHSPTLDANGKPIPDFGNGTFLVDWNKAQQLPEHDNNVGSAAFTYSRKSATDKASIDVQFSQVRDNAGNLVDATYHWDQTPGQGGSFSFSTEANVDGNPSLENLAIESRWQNDGAGRSDVMASGGDLTGSATISECWDSAFLSTYLNVSFDASQDYGTEATDCVFTSASFPQG